MTDDDNVKAADEAADAIEDATDDDSPTERWFARGYVVGLIALAVGGLASLLYFDYIDVALTVSASVSVGWILEYLIAILAAIFVTFTALMVIKAVGGNLVAAAIRAVARIAHNYELPE